MNLRDYFIYPLLVGLLILIATYFVIPQFDKKDKQFQYKINGPLKTLSKEIVGDTITIGKTKTDAIYTYYTEIVNSGDFALKDLTVLFKFENQPDNFKIINHVQTTKPKEEFGKITLLKGDSISLRYNYELINIGDEIYLTILANREADLTLYSKGEDLKIVQSSATPQAQISNRLIQIVGIALSIFASLLTLVFKSADDRIIKRLKVLFRLKSPSRQTDNIGDVFKGEWKLTYTIKTKDGLKGDSEIVTIDDKGRYHANGQYSFNLHNRIIDIDNKRISFTKVRLNGEVHSNEDLTIVDDGLIKGRDSVGFELVYEKK